VFLGLSSNTVLAQDDSVAPAATSEQGDADASGLRRIEDGSVISNEHTVKWRMCTDNARDYFVKASISLSIALSEPRLCTIFLKSYSLRPLIPVST
jgi:hypothetical protein